MVFANVGERVGDVVWHGLREGRLVRERGEYDLQENDGSVQQEELHPCRDVAYQNAQSAIILACKNKTKTQGLRTHANEIQQRALRPRAIVARRRVGPHASHIDERDEREPKGEWAAAFELARAGELVLGGEADEEEEEGGGKEEGEGV